MINNYLYSIPPLPQDPRKVVVDGCKNILKNSKEPILLTELVKQVCTENENSKSYLIGADRAIDESKITIEKNKKVRTVDESVTQRQEYYDHKQKSNKITV